MLEFVLYAKITDSWFNEQYEQLIALLNDQDKKRFDQMRSLLKREQLVLSRFLLRQAVLELSKEHNYRVESYKIENHNTLTINQQDCFSISITHSGIIAAVCISTQKIKLGIDIEKVKPRNFIELSAEICTPAELTHIKSEKYQPVSFYLLWTAKEALTKATAVNLRDSFAFDCSTTLKDSYGVFKINKTQFFYNTINLTYKSEHFVGTVVFELLNNNRSYNVPPVVSTGNDLSTFWHYYKG